MDRFTRYTGIAFIALLIFGFGYAIGHTPTPQQDQQLIFSQDMYTLASDYGTVYQLCERKYQTALSGDLPTAYRVNGQMDTLNLAIRQIIQKYWGEVSSIQ